MRIDDFVEATTPSDETIRVESEGLSVWTKYSGNGLGGNFAWFDYDNGSIVCKNPDDEIIHKMLNIAGQLGAQVQGDEGELYELTADKKITIRQPAGGRNDKINRKKAWWRLW